MKYAVYVEGKAEMLFIADILQKYSGYNPDVIGFRCINLISDSLEYIPYPSQGDESANKFYQIVNVNNDSRVISELRQDIPNLVRQGFQIIIGLKDVYGASYDAVRGSEQVIDIEQISYLHKIQSTALNVPEGVDVRLHFAIMEYETWMLSLIENFVSSAGGDLADILSSLGIDVEDDFELNVFHPAKVVEKVFGTIGKKYGKHEADQYSFLSTLIVQDYEKLRHSGKCSSFKKLLDSLGVVAEKIELQ